MLSNPCPFSPVLDSDACDWASTNSSKFHNEFARQCTYILEHRKLGIKCSVIFLGIWETNNIFLLYFLRSRTLYFFISFYLLASYYFNIGFLRTGQTYFQPRLDGEEICSSLLKKSYPLYLLMFSAGFYILAFSITLGLRKENRKTGNLMLGC